MKTKIIFRCIATMIIIMATINSLDAQEVKKLRFTPEKITGKWIATEKEMTY